MARGEDKTSRCLSAWENCHTIGSDQNCVYPFITADRMCQDEHNGSSDLCPTLTIEYSTEHDWEGDKTSRFLLALGDYHYV